MPNIIYEQLKEKIQVMIIPNVKSEYGKLKEIIVGSTNTL